MTNLNQRKRLNVLIITMLICFVGMVAGISAVYVIDNLQGKTKSVLSPSGNRVMIASINKSKVDLAKYLCVKLSIKDVESNTIMFEIQTSASDSMRWSAHWLREDLVLLRSSDIGDYCWAEIPDGSWREVDCPFPNPQN